MAKNNNEKLIYEVEKNYNLKLEGLKLRSFIIGITSTVAVLLIMLANFSSVFNSDFGNEVQVSGWSFALATLTGSFTSTSKVFGDIAVPFYYYAKDLTVLIGVFSLASLVLTIATLATVILFFIKGSKIFTYLMAGFSVLQFVTFLLCFIFALSMNKSDILPIYCSGNPKCTIQSNAVINAIIALLYVVYSVYVVVTICKLNNSKKIALNQI